jgi:hypothetical protein
VTNLALLCQVVEGSKDFRTIVDVGWRAVQLQQVEAFGLEILETAFDECGEIRGIVTVGDMWIESSSGFSGNDDVSAGFLLQLSEKAFAAPVTVNVSSIEEVDSAIDCAMESGQGLLVINGAPFITDCPSAKTNSRDIPAGATKWTILH